MRNDPTGRRAACRSRPRRRETERELESWTNLTRRHRSPTPEKDTPEKRVRWAGDVDPTAPSPLKRSFTIDELVANGPVFGLEAEKKVRWADELHISPSRPPTPERDSEAALEPLPLVLDDAAWDALASDDMSIDLGEI